LSAFVSLQKETNGIFFKHGVSFPPPVTPEFRHTLFASGNLLPRRMSLPAAE